MFQIQGFFAIYSGLILTKMFKGGEKMIEEYHLLLGKKLWQLLVRNTT